MLNSSDMLKSLWISLRARPLVRKRDILLTFLPALFWGLAFQSRPHVMTLDCAKSPESCSPSQVFALDRLAMHQRSSAADRLSFATQNLSGWIAAGAPIAWQAFSLAFRATNPALAAQNLATDYLLILQSVAWNGALIEATRLTVQRPRPFVYENPSEMGRDPAHYTSFYSGHTSFAATVGVATLLALASRGAPSWILAILLSTGVSLTGLTAILRVLAGRHFITDVVFGALIGAVISLVVALTHRRRDL